VAPTTVAVVIGMMVVVRSRGAVVVVGMLRQASKHAAVAGGHVVVIAQLGFVPHPRNHHVDHLLCKHIRCRAQ
jgi:hypothetical protein